MMHVEMDFQADDLAEAAEGDLMKLAFELMKRTKNYCQNHAVNVEEIELEEVEEGQKEEAQFWENLKEQDEDARVNDWAEAEVKLAHGMQNSREDELCREQNVLLVKGYWDSMSRV